VVMKPVETLRRGLTPLMRKQCDGEEHLLSEPEESTVSTMFPILCRLMLVYGMFWSINFLNADLFSAFLRTTIQCGADTEHCIEHPEDCVPRDVHSPDWSGSLRCLDRPYVVQQQTSLSGTLGSIGTASQIVAIPILGTIADVYGRKIVMLLGFMTVFLFGCCLVAASRVDSPNILFYAGVVLSGLNCFDPASLSMASDIAPRTPHAKSITMGLMFLSKQLFLFVTFGIGYWVLTLCLTDYLMLWIVFTAVCIAFAIFSLLSINENKREDGPKGSVLVNLWEGLKIIWHDKFILGQVLMVFVILTALYGSLVIVTSYCLMTLHYTSASASLTGILSQPAIIVGLWGAKTAMTNKRIGPYRAQLIGLALCIGGHSLMWISAICGAMHQPVWWLGFEVANISFAFLDTSRATIVSLRVPDEHQAKVQGALQICYAGGCSLGLFLWSHFLYDADAVGIQSGLGFAVSAMVLVGCSVFYMGLMQCTGVLVNDVAQDPCANEIVYENMKPETLDAANLSTEPANHV